jgi:hypothetical protein
VWIFILVLPFVALLPDFISVVVRQNHFPNPSDKFITGRYAPVPNVRAKSDKE